MNLICTILTRCLFEPHITHLGRKSIRNAKLCDEGCRSSQIVTLCHATAPFFAASKLATLPPATRQRCSQFLKSFNFIIGESMQIFTFLFYFSTVRSTCSFYSHLFHPTSNFPTANEMMRKIITRRIESVGSLRFNMISSVE